MRRVGPALFALLLSGAGGCGGGDSTPAGGAVADAEPVGENQTARVLLIGIDGVRSDVLAEEPTPALDALAAAGVIWADARNVLPTVSGPNWSSMLTGVAPAKHGVHSNDFTGHDYASYPDFLTRVEEVRPELHTAAFADWLPLITEDSGGPTLSSALDRRFFVDGYEAGWAEADRAVVREAVAEVERGEVDALFVYLGNPDEVSHETGAIGSEYRAAIREADAHVGALARAVAARPSEEDWLILVSTDHGRRPDGGHGEESEEERTIFVILSPVPGTASPAGREPIIYDVPATALDHLGIAIPDSWGLDGRSLLR